MIDRITNSLVKDFKLKFGISDEKHSDFTIFEHFINYTILEKKLEDRIDEDFLEKVNIGKNGTFGLDGFCMLINKHLITNLEDLKEILDKNKKPVAELYFIQAKTENNFDVTEIGHFGNAIEDFVSIAPKYKWSENALDCINLFQSLINRSNELESNPNCYIYFACLGNYNKDQNLEAKKQYILESIRNQKVFNDIYFNYYDSNLIQSEYKKIGQNISKTFEFSKKTLIPEIENVDEAYIGVVSAKTIIDLIEEDNELITSVF